MNWNYNLPRPIHSVQRKRLIPHETIITLFSRINIPIFILLLIDYINPFITLDDYKLYIYMIINYIILGGGGGVQKWPK